MAVHGYGHLFVQDTTPAEAPVMVGSIWSDTADGSVKVCTAISPYTFAAISGGTVLPDPVTVPHGGTGVATLAAHGVLLGAGAANVVVTGAGLAGQVLTSNGASADPTYQVIAPTATPQITSNTGAQNNFDLTARSTYLRCTGAAPVFSGFTVLGATPSDGDQVLIECQGTTARVTNQDTNSTITNRVVCPSTNGQIIGANGRMLLVYDGTAGRWRESLLDCGAWIAVPYNAGDYTGSGSQTWTVDSGDLDTGLYKQQGTTLFVQYYLKSTSVGGTPAGFLQITLPAGFTAGSNAFSMCFVQDAGGTSAAGLVRPVTTILRVQKIDGSNWGASTNSTFIGVAIPVNIT